MVSRDGVSGDGGNGGMYGSGGSGRRKRKCEKKCLHKRFNEHFFLSSYIYVSLFLFIQLPSP